jgi:hypothetical protein
MELISGWWVMGRRPRKTFPSRQAARLFAFVRLILRSQVISQPPLKSLHLCKIFGEWTELFLTNLQLSTNLPLFFDTVLGILFDAETLYYDEGGQGIHRF